MQTSIPWEMLPQEMGTARGRRSREWQQAQVWDQLQQVLLPQLRGADKPDLSV